MVPYYWVIGASLAGAPLLNHRPQYRRRYLLVLGAACWLLASFRYVTGFDYRFYEATFQTIAESGLANWSEPGYLLLNLAVSFLGGGYRVFLFVFHFLLTALVFIWIGRYSPSPWMSVFLFLTLQHFALSMNFLRQAFAAAIILWVWPFLRSRRCLPVCGIVLLAACFHRTALIMLPLCFLLALPPSRLHYGLAALVTGIAYFLMDPLIQIVVTLVPKYQHYLTEKYWQGNSFIYVLLPLGCFLFVLPLLRQKAGAGADAPILSNSMFYSLLLHLFITRHFILERLSVYIAMFALLALPTAALVPYKRISSKIRISLLITGSCVYFLFAVSQGFHGVYPYRGIWDRAISP